MNLALSFYKIARVDFNVSKILYDKLEYSNSIYHLQQSVEKLSKAFGLITQIVKSGDIDKKISHNTKMIFTKNITAQQENFNKLTEINQLFPDFAAFEIGNTKIDFEQEGKNFNNQTKHLLHLQPEDYRYLEDEDIDSIKAQLDSINIETELDLEGFEDKFPLVFNSIFEQLEHKTGLQVPIEDKEMLTNKDTVAIFKEGVIEIIPNVMKFGYLYTSLFLLTLITASHNQTTRYPCLCCGEMPEDIYTRGEMPLVERLSEIFEILDKTFCFYEDVFLSNGNKLEN